MEGVKGKGEGNIMRQSAALIVAYAHCAQIAPRRDGSFVQRWRLPRSPVQHHTRLADIARPSQPLEASGAIFYAGQRVHIMGRVLAPTQEWLRRRMVADIGVGAIGAARLRFFHRQSGGWATRPPRHSRSHATSDIGSDRRARPRPPPTSFCSTHRAARLGCGKLTM